MSIFLSYLHTSAVFPVRQLSHVTLPWWSRSYITNTNKGDRFKQKNYSSRWTKSTTQLCGIPPARSKPFSVASTSSLRRPKIEAGEHDIRWNTGFGSQEEVSARLRHILWTKRVGKQSLSTPSRVPNVCLGWHVARPTLAT